MDKYMVESWRTCTDQAGKQEWWADSHQQSSWRSTTQCNHEINVHHHQSLSHHVKRMVLTGVADSRSLCSVTSLSFSSVKMSFAACHYNAVWSNPITVQPHLIHDQVQQSLWGSRTSHPFDFNGGMTRKIISTFRLRFAQPAIVTWARKKSPRLKSSVPYCSLVVSTPDVHR